MTVSVAMAVYNGEKFIVEQIESILNQLTEEDELIISVNPCSDNTEKIIDDYKTKESRIQVVKCFNKGVIPNFENAITHCKNDIIFLSDQDDIWVNEKIKRQLEVFADPLVGGVCHGCSYIDADGKLLSNQPEIGKRRTIKRWEIIKKNPVQGSSLAFRQELRELFLPFPSSIPMHDSWIGINICAKYKLIYLDEPLIMYRQHEGSVTVREHKNVSNMIKDRTSLLISFLQNRKNKKGSQK